MLQDRLWDINLPGWSDQSIWGYDAKLECYWAQLWRDEDHTERPRIWISLDHLIPTLFVLVLLVAEALDVDQNDVYLAMTA